MKEIFKGRVSAVRRGVAVLALCCSALTSPFLETLAADQPNDEAAAARPLQVSPTATVPTTSVVVAPVTPPVTTMINTVATTTSTDAAPDPAAITTVAVGATPARAALDPQWKAKISPDYFVEDAGCARDLSAAGLADFFAQPLGPIKGFDEPRMYPLGDGRTLWALQDAFVDETGTAKSFAHMGYANSMMLIQQGTCFTSLRRGSAGDVAAFEVGTGDISFDRYFWPAGGAVSGGTFQLFWMEMVRDPTVGGPLDGIALHPVTTWLATYDLATMQRLSFVPAANAGVSPVYGYTVVENGSWDYLFGNTYLQNLSLEGGYANGPHSATRMYLARVPRGHLEASPTYWNGTDWTHDASAAAPISSRYWTENLIMPVVIDGRWISATKVDGFLGSTVSIDIAATPWGPWTTVSTIPSTPRGDPTDIVTYHASVLPISDPGGGLIVTLSQIPLDLGRNDAPPKYRPTVISVTI